MAAAAAAHLDRAIALLLSEQSGDADVRTGLLELLDAVAASVPPSAETAASCGGNIALARWQLSHTGPAHAPALSLVANCYQETHGGTTFRVPRGLATPDDARAFIRQRLTYARDLLERGRTREAVPPLIETVLMILTPRDVTSTGS